MKKIRTGTTPAGLDGRLAPAVGLINGLFLSVGMWAVCGSVLLLAS